MIRLHLLGAVDLRDRDGTEVRRLLAQPKRLALLAYLAVAEGAPHRRDRLLALFWPELEADRARNALSKGIHFLRQCLGPEAIITRTTEEVAVDPAAVWCDAVAFRLAIKEGRLDEALGHYHGDLLPAFYIPQARQFEEWLDHERGAHRAQAARAAQTLAERLAEARSTTGALDRARLALELADGDERTLRQVVSLLHRLGDRAGAIRAYERFKTRLEAEVGGRPSAETVALIEQIRRTAPFPEVPLPRGPSSAAPSADPAGALDRFTAAIADRYQVEGTLGKGGMAMVLLATDQRLHRRVAVKLLRPELMGPGMAERFRSEIFIAAALNHPHVVPLLESGEAAGFLYYVMPWHSGQSLRDRLDREAPLPVADAIRIARDVADGLTAAHDRGIVHRDIKPENILLGADHALLADFGIARTLEERPGITPIWTSGASGTPAYVSPEQARGVRELDGRCDVYALGCVLYEMLSGRVPFESDTIEGLLAHHQFTAVVPLRTLRPEVPAPLASLVERSLAKQPYERPGGAREFLNALNALSFARPSPTRWRWAIAAGGLSVAALLVGSSLLRPGPPLPADRPQLMLANVDAGSDSLTGLTLTLALRTDLTGSRYYQVVAPQRVAAVLRRMDRPGSAWVDDTTAKEIAVREGIPLIASVTVRPLQGKYLLVGQVIRQDGQEVGAARVTADSVLSGLGELSRKLRRLAGDRSGEADARPPLPKVTTSSLEALRLYTLATTRPAPFPERSSEIELLERAVGLDSTFAMAYRILSIRYLQMRQFSKGRRAFRVATEHRDRLTEIERNFLAGTGATQSGYPDTAAQRQAMDNVLALDPQNWTALVNRGSYETWFAEPGRGEPYGREAIAVDSVHQGAWLLLFWARLGTGDTAGASSALREGTRLNGRVEPFLHEWAIYGWRTGDYSIVERLLDSLRRLPGGRDKAREDLAIIGNSVQSLRGHHRQAEEGWRELALGMAPERRDQLLASILFRRAECGTVAGSPAARIASRIEPEMSGFDLRSLEPDERGGTANYLAGAWGWLGRADRLRSVYRIGWTPDSLLTPYVVHRRELALLFGLLSEGKDREVIARAHLHNNSPQTGESELPLALAFDRAGLPDSALAAGERFLRRRTFIALTADMACAEQALRQRMGELYEAKADTLNALRHYRHFTATWRDPDPEFRPRVATVKARITALSSSADR